MQADAEPPPDGPGADGVRAWWRRNWGFIAATALGAIVGGLIGVASSGTDTTSTSTTTQALIATQTDTTTVADVQTETQTETETETVTAEQAQPARDGSPQSFSGDGPEDLGTLEVAVDSTLDWTNSGALFQVFDASFGITVSSLAPSGSTSVAAGTYPDVFVNAVGSWTITINPV